MRGRWWFAALAAVICCDNTFAGIDTLSDWPKECVGRLKLELPGEADQGAILGNERFRKVEQYGVPLSRFPDGEQVGWTEFSTELAKVVITHPLAASEIRTASKTIVLDENERFVEDVSVGSRIIWARIVDRVNESYLVPLHSLVADLLVSNNVLFTWNGSAKEEDLARANAMVQSVAEGLRPRSPSELPTVTGLCFPYLFLPDDGKKKHSIAMSFRLKEHPDIFINLRSRTAKPTPKQGDWERPETVTNEYLSQTFYDGLTTSSAGMKSVESVWSFPAMKRIRLAGRPGREIFVAVIRKNEKEEDYIYHAVARGDPEHPEAVPDIRLIVQQKRENALKRGSKPLTKHEVLELAREIAASIEPRMKN